jgi:hypothetical protein
MALAGRALVVAVGLLLAPAVLGGCEERTALSTGSNPKAAAAPASNTRPGSESATPLSPVVDQASGQGQGAGEEARDASVGPAPTIPLSQAHDAGQEASAEAGDTGPDGWYATMCRHYCETLKDSFIYSCLGSGGDLNGCTGKARFYDQCYDLRCVPPGRVQPSLCLTQCDVLARGYEPVCGSADAATMSVCPTSPAEHDSACRAGCVTPPAQGADAGLPPLAM